MKKKVFFLGAGYSKAIDNSYPLLTELTKYVKDNIGDKDSLEAHYNSEMADSMKDNIESLLTYLSTDFPWKTEEQKSINKALYYRIIKIIQKKFEELPLPTKLENTNTMMDFIAEHNEEYDFITLNYDLILETLLSKALNHTGKEIHSYAKFYKYPILSIGNRIPKSAFGFAPNDVKPYKIPSILKLHGSSNWLWAGFSPTDTIYYTNSQMKEDENIDAGLSPYIVPPVMDKNNFYNHIVLKFLWSEAEKLLKDADEIYIIGFSFPQTDLSVKFLFQSSLRKSKAKIYVVNASKESELRINYNQVFGEDNSKVSYEFCGKYNFDANVLNKFIKAKMIKSDTNA